MITAQLSDGLCTTAALGVAHLVADVISYCGHCTLVARADVLELPLPPSVARYLLDQQAAGRLDIIERPWMRRSALALLAPHEHMAQLKSDEARAKRSRERWN